MKVMIGAGQVVHEGLSLKTKGQWGQSKRPICGAKGNTGRVIRSACFEVDDTAVVTCKKCLALIAQREKK